MQISTHQIYHSKYTGFFVWFLAAMFYSLQMTLRILPVMMFDHFTNKFSMDAAELGMLTGCYYIGYAGMQIPIGILLDKYHPRYVISACIMICVVGILLTIYSESKVYVYFSRLMIGVGSAAGILGAVKSIDDFFPKKYSIFLGMTVFCGVFGAFYGGKPIGEAISNFGVEHTLMMLVYIAISLCFALLLLYKKSHTEDKVTKTMSFLSIINSCLLDKKIWFIGFLGGLMVGPMGGFADGWGNKYLVEGKGMDVAAASEAISLIFLGLGVGSSVTGYVADKLKSLSNLISLIGAVQILIMIWLFVIESDNSKYIYPLTFLIGLFSSSQVIVFALANKLSKNHMVSVVTSFVNTMIMLFCFIFNYGVGLILKTFFKSLSAEKVIYSEEAYCNAFSLILFSIFLGIIGFRFLIKQEKLI